MLLLQSSYYLLSKRSLSLLVRLLLPYFRLISSLPLVPATVSLLDPCLSSFSYLSQLRRALPTEEELISPSSKEIKDLLADGIKLLDVIGSGGYSTVFRATHISSGHIIAIKRIEEWVPYGLVENEVKALRLFRTFPDKTQYFGYYRTSEGVHYIGTELMWGTLYKLLQQRAAGLKTSMSAVAYVAERISSSILDLHRLRMVHRDIKPENFLLDVKGRLRLCKLCLFFFAQFLLTCLCLADFGLVKRLDNDARTKTYTGTPGFMAPEITREGVNAYDAYKADVFAFGRMSIAHYFPFPSD